MSRTIKMVADIIEANGRTIRENNAEIKHKIPIGSLVETKFEKRYGNGAGRCKSSIVRDQSRS